VNSAFHQFILDYIQKHGTTVLLIVCHRLESQQQRSIQITIEQKLPILVFIACLEI